MDQANGNKLVPRKEKPNGSIKLKKAIVKKSEPKEGDGSGMLCMSKLYLFGNDSSVNAT